MRVYVATVGIIKEGREPVGVFWTYDAASTYAKKRCDPDYQEWSVEEFDVNEESAEEP